MKLFVLGSLGDHSSKRMSRFALALIALAASGLAPTDAHALDYSYGGMKVTVEPIVGFEWAPKSDPSQHLHGRLMYGARITGGAPYLSIEAEYTRATDQEEFSTGLSTRDTDDRIKLGLRSGYQLNSFFEAHARAGGQAEKNQHEETPFGGPTTTTSNPVVVNPYAGLGLRGTLSSRTYVSLDLVVTFHDIHDMQKNEYQTTTGFAVQFP